MTPCVRTWSIVPYGGMWHFTEPNLGFKVVARNRDALMREARHRFKANGLPVGLEFERYVEDLICQEMPDECALCIEGRSIRPPTPVAETVKQGVEVWIKSKFTSAQPPDDAEVQRRAAICYKCPWRTELAGGCGGGCGAIEEAVVKAFGARNTGIDLQRSVCSNCACFIRAAVCVNLEIQQSVLTDQQKEDFRMIAKNYPCWKAVGL